MIGYLFEFECEFNYIVNIRWGMGRKVNINFVFFVFGVCFGNRYFFFYN